MGIEDQPENDVVFQESFECADQEREAAGGVGDVPDELVAGAREPGFVNLNVELVKGFRLLANNFWSDGGGRYIFGQAPDLIVRNDGSLSPIKTGSTLSGFEFTHQNTFLYAYYGGVYVQRNTALDTTTGKPIGYGFDGAASSLNQNRTIHEATFGFNQTLWRDAKYGALNFMGQYSYLQRNPWSIPVGSDREGHLNMVFLNLRYTLPGSAPRME